VRRLQEKGGVNKRSATGAAIEHPRTTDGGKEEVGAVLGGDVEDGSGPPKITVDGSGVENNEEGGGDGGIKECRIKGVPQKEGQSGEGIIGGDGSLRSRKGASQRGDSDCVEDGDVGAPAKVESHAWIPRKGPTTFGRKRSKTMSSSKIAGIGGENNASSG